MHFPAAIDQVWLFGSRARNTASPTSDTDMLIVADELDVDNLRSQLRNKFGDRLDIAHYTYDGIFKLVSSSSLFAIHLKQEGVPIFKRSNRLQNMLTEMPDYNSHLNDLRILRQLLDDTSSLADSRSWIFEYGILGTVIRNTGIIMTHYLGKTDFSVNAPLTLAQLRKDLVMPVSAHTYNLLQGCRKSGERGFEVDTTNLNGRFSDFHKSVAQWHELCTTSIIRNEH